MQERMKELVAILSEASKAYYAESREIMSNFEYDALYDELVALEDETGITLAGSPTQRVGYEVVSELPKERHASPMLSLDKTKEVEVLQSFLGEQKGILSWKLDGLTVVLQYSGGKLVKAVTRGNGEIGEVITNNAKTFVNVPLTIPYEGDLTLRGEAIITYKEFERINSEISDADAKYKNPRNLCSGSVRQLNNKVTADRHVRFVVFNMVSAGDVDFSNSHLNEFEWVKSLGLEVVEHREVTAETLPEDVKWFSEQIAGSDYPSDGLVLLMDDIQHGIALGRTAKFPRNAMAFKWSDETADTTITEIEWSPSRTGLINPVAIFEPVELEGTTVSRASVHNVSVLEELQLAVGDRVTVYKANMIIPQIAENLTRKGPDMPPAECPVCGAATKVQQANEAKVLICTNEHCPAKHIGSFEHFVSRDAMNIDGISAATIEKFIEIGVLKDYADLFTLEGHREEIVALDGYGNKAFDKLVAAAETASHTTLPRVLNAIGIPNVGESNAKILSAFFDHDIHELMKADAEELSGIDGVGPIMASNIVDFFADEANREQVEKLLAVLDIQAPEAGNASGADLSGKTFVITGSLENFSNRKDLQALIEQAGGKVSGSVSAKTAYLINNDVTSNSSKNKKAKELGVEIIDEAQIMEMLGLTGQV